MSKMSKRNLEEQEELEEQEKRKGIPGRLDPPLLPDIEHGKLDGLDSRVRLARNGSVIDAQQHDATRPSIASLPASIAREGGGRSREGPDRKPKLIPVIQ
jgi:hypothetical protein